MGIVYPRPLPASFSSQAFSIKRNDYTSPENSGRIGGVQAGWPRWSAQWVVGTTKRDVSDQIEAWLDSLRGAQKRFLGRDLRRPYPIAHIGGFRRMLTVAGAPFFGSAAGWSQAIDAEGSTQVTLTGLPSGLILKPIDYVGFKWDGTGSAVGTWDRRALVRVLSGAIADATGSVTVTVEPAVPDWVPAAAIAHLDNPACLMKLTTDTEMAAVDQRQIVKGTKIVGVQVLVA